MSDQKMRALFQELKIELQFTLQGLYCPPPRLINMDKVEKGNSCNNWYDLILTRYR